MASYNINLAQIMILTIIIITNSSSVRTIRLEEATVDDLQRAFEQNELTSRQLVEFYLERIQRLNPILRGVIEVNPDALLEADRADHERKCKVKVKVNPPFSRLHGIPILVKDNIATRDKMNTTAGSFALLGSEVARDAGVVARLRRAGAIVLGKASLSEWSHYRSDQAPSGWCARSDQGLNPYNPAMTPCGSSSGSAISAAANLATVTLGTETDGSILCPSSLNSVVGFKPTVGLTSRAGVVPISPRQDSVGPICRTVSDAAYVLEAIVGEDKHDIATIGASKLIPKGGYAQFLKRDGLRGKRIGIVRHPFFEFILSQENINAFLYKTFEHHFKTLRKEGAILIDNLEIANIDEISSDTSEDIAMRAEFKMSLNVYLKELVTSPVRTLADAIAFNNRNTKLEKVKEYGQNLFTEAETTNGIGPQEKAALEKMETQTREGFVKLMKKYKLDALVASGGTGFPYQIISKILAIGGFPGITVPAGYLEVGENEIWPFGISFGGLKGSEPKLIEIAYGFEQATKVRKPPSLETESFVNNI